jgi:CRP-like cAMP-binding protein
MARKTNAAAAATAGSRAERAVGAPPRESALFRNLFRRVARPPTNQQFLAGLPLFEGLSPRELKKVAGIIHERHYPAAELIFEQGTPGAALFIVKSGAVELVRQDGAGHDLAKLATLHEGMFFGEGALLHEENRVMSARATEPTDVLAFFRGDLDVIIKSAPAVGGKILLRLAWVLNRRLQTAMEEHFRQA